MYDITVAGYYGDFRSFSRRRIAGWMVACLMIPIKLIVWMVILPPPYPSRENLRKVAEKVKFSELIISQCLVPSRICHMFNVKQPPPEEGFPNDSGVCS